MHILVTASPSNFKHQLALDFAVSLEESIRNRTHVFFYSDAVLVASKEHQFMVTKSWAELSLKGRHVCIGAAESRHLDAKNIHPEFSLDGLGELAEMISQENVVHF